MRGKELSTRNFLKLSGITPAYAGKSYSSLRPVVRCGDHPRVCGEKKKSGGSITSKTGSPPRMRGKASCFGSMWFVLGITPAYAGKSKTPSPTSTRTGDHPRVCGEKLIVANEPVADVGSPPRMRGKVHLPRLLRCPSGITPAYAGKRRRGATKGGV